MDRASVRENNAITFEKLATRVSSLANLELKTSRCK